MCRFWVVPSHVSTTPSLHATFRGYGRLPFPLAELSLEGNPIEAPVLAAITNALQQLSPQQSYLKAFRKGERWQSPPAPGGVTERITGALPSLGKLRRTQSQPNLEGAASPDIFGKKGAEWSGHWVWGDRVASPGWDHPRVSRGKGRVKFRARGCVKITLWIVCSLFDSTFCILVWSCLVYIFAISQLVWMLAASERTCRFYLPSWNPPKRDDHSVQAQHLRDEPISEFPWAVKILDWMSLLLSLTWEWSSVSAHRCYMVHILILIPLLRGMPQKRRSENMRQAGAAFSCWIRWLLTLATSKDIATFSIS